MPYVEPLSYREGKALWKKIRKKVPKNGNSYVIEAIPIQLRSWFRKYSNYNKQYHKKHFSFKSLDDRIYLHKWYPWCYKDYKPTLVLVGWYSVERAKDVMIRKFGKDALKEIKFVKGRDALEKDFKVGVSLYIGGRWIPFKSKIALPKSHTSGKIYRKRIIGGDDKVKMGTNPLRKERLIHRNIHTYEYGNRDIIPKVKPKKKLQLQKIRKVNSQGKKDIYQE